MWARRLVSGVYVEEKALLIWRSFINLTCWFVFMLWPPLFSRVKNCVSWKAVVVLAGCLSVRCRLRPVVGYAMASLRQHSAAPVAGGSSRFCYQTERESLSISECLFSNSWREHCSVFSVHWQPHLLPMNGCVVRRRSPPPPPPEVYSRQITWRSWKRNRAIWHRLHYMHQAVWLCLLIVAMLKGNYLLYNSCANKCSSTRMKLLWLAK